jgi:predicted porin
MTSLLRRFQPRAGTSLPALMIGLGMLASGVLGASSAANAQSANDAEIQALRAQVEQLQRAVNQLTSGQKQSTADAKAARDQASEAKVKADKAVADASKAQAKAQAATVNANAALIPAATKAAADVEIDAQGHRFFEKKKGNPLTFYTTGGEITAYGNIDVSVDATSKSVTPLTLENGASGPVGNFGVLPALSTNSSYLGVRGFQRISSLPFNFVYQFELGFDVTATPGIGETNSNLSNSVNGALFNRNTYIGFANPEFGAIKIGKTDAPYQLSTGGFNPFAGEIGDYRVIVGNSGGDNRVEFATRLEHAIWYESPTIAGFQGNILISPGQNRADNSDNIAAGSSNCTGGNDPTSGGLAPFGCNDGGFSNAYSANLSYTNGGLYSTFAYERHEKVNRQSDITGIFGVTQNIGGGGSNVFNDAITSLQAIGPNATRLFLEDVGTEDAFKVGALYNFKSTGTTVGGLFEVLRRQLPAELNFQNERQRNDTWVFVTQEITENDSVSVGWAHAFRAVGDPGQHNDGTLTTVDGGTVASNDNSADMVTANYKRKFGPNLTWYTAVAATFNSGSAHYDLGAGGRGVTTDCHDAFAAPGGAFAVTHCFTGTTLAGISTGVQWRF